MPAVLSYPATRHEPSLPVDLADPKERARISEGAVRAFFNIMARWRLRDEIARRLLGGISNGAYYALKKSPDKVLDEDRLLRISYLIGIFSALNVLYGDEYADRWVRQPNRNRIFRGQAPVDYMLRGGLPAFATVRALVDARLEGG